MKTSRPDYDLKTKRLILRKIHRQVAPDLFKIKSQPEVFKYLSKEPHQYLQDTEDFVIRVCNDANLGKIYFWVIREKKTEQMMGTICLWNFTKAERVAEIGYELHPDYVGQGYMTEAIHSVLDFVIQSLSFVSIEAFTQDNNDRSIRLLKKNGFDLQPNRVDKDYPRNVIYQYTIAR